MAEATFKSVLMNTNIEVSVKVTDYYAGYSPEAVLQLLKDGHPLLKMKSEKQSHFISLEDDDGNHMIIAKCIISYEPIEIDLEKAIFADSQD